MDDGEGDFDDDGLFPGHEPEIGFTITYCPDCNITYTFRSVSYPGGRESEPITCPDCRKPLGGNIETDSTVESRTPGGVPGQSFETAKYGGVEDNV